MQIIKGTNGARQRRPIDQAHQVIQLASRVCQFDLAKEFGISQAVVETLDTTYSLAIGAGSLSPVLSPACVDVGCAFFRVLEDWGTCRRSSFDQRGCLSSRVGSYAQCRAHLPAGRNWYAISSRPFTSQCVGASS